ncbi:MAG: hypothetical protein AABZ77_09505 [Chloroflexota bacterium]
MATATPENTKDTDRALEGEINISLTEGRLPCPMAFKAARKLNIIPMAVGNKADELGIKVSNCQLGCFGKEKATHEELRDMQVAPAIAEAVRASLVSGKIPCKTAYEVAKKLKVSRRKVGDTASKLNIKVADCQLGCF